MAVDEDLLNAVAAVGDGPDVARRGQDQLDVGADHVAVQLMLVDLTEPPTDDWRRFAPAVRELAAQSIDRREQLA